MNETKKTPEEILGRYTSENTTAILSECENDEGVSVVRVRKLSKALHKECNALEIPMALIYYTQEKGYEYKALLPGEFKNNGQLKDNPDNRFLKSLSAMRGFDINEIERIVIQENSES